MTIPKYTIRGPIDGRIDDYYVMENGEEATFFDWQAQAEICAWAFNVVARGDRLAYMSDSKNVGEPGAYGFYEGPTEGVREP